MDKRKKRLVLILIACIALIFYIVFFLLDFEYDHWMKSFDIPANLGDIITDPSKHSIIEIDGYKYYSTGRSVLGGSTMRVKEDGIVDFGEDWGKCKYWNSNYIKVETPDGIVGYRGYKVIELNSRKYCIDELTWLTNDNYYWALAHQGLSEDQWAILEVPDQLSYLKETIIFNNKEYDRLDISADALAWYCWYKDLPVEYQNKIKDTPRDFK